MSIPAGTFGSHLLSRQGAYDYPAIFLSQFAGKYYTVYPMGPALSVIIAGFGTREPSWDRVRACLHALATQQVSKLEVLLCHIPELPGKVPQDIGDICPGTKLLESAGKDANSRKTEAVRSAGAPVVALLDADCLPHPSWAKALLEAFDYYPEIAALTGRMLGEKPAWFERAFPGTAGPARVLATSNVAYRREAFLDYPLLAGDPVEAVMLQSSAMRRAGYVLWSDPEVQVLRDRRGRKPPATAVAGSGLAAQQG